MNDMTQIGHGDGKASFPTAAARDAAIQDSPLRNFVRVHHQPDKPGTYFLFEDQDRMAGHSALRYFVAWRVTP